MVYKPQPLFDINKNYNTLFVRHIRLSVYNFIIRGL